jgi:hypothetical protein
MNPSDTRPKLAQLVFTPGNYDHGLACYEAAKDWVLKNRLFNSPGVKGLIHSPRFRGRDLAGQTIPDEWIEEHGWQTSVELDFSKAANKFFAAWLKTLPLPEHSTLEFLP